MRYIYFILTGLLPFTAVMAQRLPEGASPMISGAYDTATNAIQKKSPPQSSPLMLRQEGDTTNAPPSGFSLQDAPQEVLPLVAEAYRETVPAAPAGQTNDTRIAFLMDAGLQYADEGEYKSAEQAYLRALEAAPGNPGIRFRLGTLYIQMGRYKEAADILSSLAADFPDSPMVHNNLAWIYSTAGEIRNGTLALKHAREAILSAPAEASMWNTLAEAYYVAGQYDKALRSAEYAIELFRRQNGAEADAAEFEAQRTKIRRAEEAAEKLTEMNGGK